MLHETVVEKDYILVGIYGFLSGLVNFGSIYRLSGLGALGGIGGCGSLISGCFGIAFILVRERLAVTDSSVVLYDSRAVADLQERIE